MKKIGICLMVVLTFVLVGNTIYDFRMNSRYSVVQFQPSDMMAAEIKEEFPAIAFSQEDRALHADVMALPEVQVALEAEKETIFTREEGAALLAEYLTEGMHLEEFSVSDGVHVRFRDADHRKTAYTFDEAICQKRFPFMKNIPDGIGTVLLFIKM